MSSVRTRVRSLIVSSLTPICVPPVAMGTTRTGGLQHRYTRTGGARPYGVACLIAGFDEDTLLPCVFRSEPSGAFAEWTASAVGKASDKVRGMEQTPVWYLPTGVATQFSLLAGAKSLCFLIICV